MGLRLPELIIILLVVLVIIVIICVASSSNSSGVSGQPPMNPYQQIPPTQGNPVGYQPQPMSPNAPQPAAPTRFCEQCGHPIDAAVAFCPNCGAPVKR